MNVNLSVGDKVVNKISGERGYVGAICNCGACNLRGWHEIAIYLDNGYKAYIENLKDYDDWEIVR